MLFLLRQIRRKTLMNNKFTTYLMYAIGEIILVVVGILIAVQIDGWNQERLEAKAELDNYQDIINDLRKDSIRFQNRILTAKEHLDCYYKLNEISIGAAPFNSGALYDFVVMTITFDPTTKANHQNTIQNLNDHEVRNDINIYFANEYRVKEASEEFNKLISEVSRPYILEDKNAFDNSQVFIEEKYVFPPLLGKSTLDNQKLKEIVYLPRFTSIISELRMSAGLFLFEIENLNSANTALIKKLESKLK